MPSHAHIPGCARLNVGRLNAFRLNDAESIMFASVGGVDRSHNLRIEGASVQHVLNDQPDTAAVTAHGFTPVAGQTLAIYDGDRTLDRQIFGGRILGTTVRYESRPQNVAWDLQGIDPTWLLNRRRVLWQYTNQSATAIVLHLMTFASGVTTAHVQPGLPVIDALTFTNETVAACLTAVCERIGGYWYLDYAADLHVFLQESPDATPITDAAPHGSADHTLTEDLSQVVTRVIARGAGAGAATDLVAGATELPIDLGDAPNFYAVGGGLAEVSAQRLTYSGVRGLGGTGALVGSGNSPSTAPYLVSGAATGMTIGAAYQYAVSFMNESNAVLGETLPGPVVTAVPSGALPTIPTGTCWTRHTNITAGTPGPVIGGVYHFRFVFNYAGGAGGRGVATNLSDATTYDGKYWEIYLGPLASHPANGSQPFNYFSDLSGPPNTPYLQVLIFRTLANAGWDSQYYGAGHFDLGSGPVWRLLTYNPPDSDIAQEWNKLPVTGPPMASIRLYGIPTSSLGSVKQRKLYRTAANGAQLKLLATIANNTATEYWDAASDAGLGAPPSSSDESGITDNRQVPPGVVSLPVSSTAPFEQDGGNAGGWARVGQLVVKYGGLGVNLLTGLPPTGPGALTAAVRYGTQVLVQPRLTGVAGLLRAVRKGETIQLRIEVDDVAAQIALTERLGSVNWADGVVEEVYSDSRMTLSELADYAAALLADRKDPRRTLTFTTRDASCQVGRLITVALTTPPISGTFRIQRISFSEIAISGGLGRVAPKRTIEASNKLFTFADLLRRLRGREGGAR